VSATRYFTIEAVELLGMDGDPNKGMSFIRYRPDDDPEKGYHSIMMPDEFARFARAFGEDRESWVGRKLSRVLYSSSLHKDKAPRHGPLMPVV